ncbi:hypothetical protein C2F69_RS22240 [Vibrio parahaemolyticus]|nr:hypothetical protein [Vibrio parahaemolyticus]
MIFMCFDALKVRLRLTAVLPLKPLGIFNAAENGLTTPKSVLGKAISQCGLSTNSLKPRELTTPEKATSQQTNPLLERQIHRTEFQQQI